MFSYTTAGPEGQEVNLLRLRLHRAELTLANEGGLNGATMH